MRLRGIKAIAALVLCGTFVVNLTGCSYGRIVLQAAEEKTVIDFSWWGTDDRHDYTMEAVKEFEKQHPDIDVHMQYTEWSGYDRKSAIQMAAHTEADVMQINYAWLDRFSADGKGYYDLKKLSDDLSLEGYDKTQLDYGTSNGVLNALPIALNSKVCLYNKDIYESYSLSLPETWDDLYKAADAMRGDGIYPFDLDQVCSFMFSVAYVEQKTGKSFTTKDNRLNFNEDDVKEMIGFYMNLVDKKVVPFVGERDDANYKNGVTAGNAQWITNAAGSEADLKATKEQTTVVGVNPMLKGAKRSGWYVKPATMYSVSKNTKHPKEAAMLLDFLVNSEEVAKLQGLEKGIPVSTKARSALEKDGGLAGIQVSAEEAMNKRKVELMSPYFEDAGLQEAFVRAATAMKYDGAKLKDAAKLAYDGMKADLG